MKREGETKVDRIIETDTSSPLPLSSSLTEKISRAKAKLLVEYPYFGTLASRLELSRNDDIGSFLSDGTRFEFNDDYLEGLSLDELGFALANGAMHAALAHESRQMGRMGWLWQLATDHAINAMLIENGLSRPEMINYDPRFEGMYAEEIYAHLKEEIKNEEFDDNEANDTGFNEQNKRHQQQLQNAEGNRDTEGHRPRMEVENEYHAPKDISSENEYHAPKERAAEEEQLEQLAREALEKMQTMGELPGGIERFFMPDAVPKIDWRRELSLSLEGYYQNDYRMMPPSKKLLYAGTYLPSLDSDFFRAVLAIDSSGSVDGAMLGLFIAEIESLLLQFPNYRIDLFVCDAKVQSHRTFYGGEMLEYDLKGGGGTDFRPLFDYIEAHLPQTQLLLYFTDAQGRFPEGEPLYDTLWITPEEAAVPFGRVIVMQED
jgi:predicted metal-dependent peptidase